VSLQYKHFKVTVDDPSISGGKTQPVALQPEDAADLPWKLGHLKIDLEGLAEPGSLQGSAKDQLAIYGSVRSANDGKFKAHKRPPKKDSVECL